VRELSRIVASIDPCIVHIHFASRGSTLRKMILADMVTRAGRPLVLHAHGGYFDQFHRRLPGVLRRTVDGILQRANLVITLSSRWRDFYVNECEVSPSHVTVLPNPVRWTPDLPNRAGRSTCSSCSSAACVRRRALTTSSMRSLRCPMRYARARASRSRAMEISKPSANLPSHTVSRCGCCRGSTARSGDRLLAQSDVFVLPSHHEGVPMALLEAMAAGLPAIVTPVGGIPDVLRHGVEGLMVEPAHVTELCAAMTRLVNHDGERIAAGRRAHERARGFDVHAYARNLAEIYQRIGSPWPTTGTFHESQWRDRHRPTVHDAHRRTAQNRSSRADRMQQPGWYLQRLKGMSGAEVAHRLARKVRLLSQKFVSNELPPAR
jgi:hypothetical protein